MTTLYWQIAPELDQLRRQAERMLDERSRAAAPRPWRPAAALSDLGDRYEVQLQLPGMTVEQLEIEATCDSINVSGDRPVSEGRLIHSEFRAGAFERKIRLPEKIQHQQVEANYEQGLLTLHLPKLTAAVDYQVQVPVTTAANLPTSNAAPDPTPMPEAVPVSEAASPSPVASASQKPVNATPEQVADAETKDLWADPAD